MGGVGRFLIILVLFGRVLLAEEVHAVVSGSHRAIAVLILTKTGAISRDLVVGTHGHARLTAGTLVDLYDQGRLTTWNFEEYRPFTPWPQPRYWFREKTVEEILSNFQPDRLFAGSSLEAKGILLKPGDKARGPFSNLRGNTGYGIPVADYIAQQLAQRACGQLYVGANLPL